MPPLLRGAVGVVPNIGAFAMHQKQTQLWVLVAVKPRFGSGCPQLFQQLSVIADAGTAFDVSIQIGAVFAESHTHFGMASLHTATQFALSAHKEIQLMLLLQMLFHQHTARYFLVKQSHGLREIAPIGFAKRNHRHAGFIHQMPHH